MTDVFRMRQLKSDVSRLPPRVTAVCDLLAIEEHDEMIAVDRRFDRVPLIRDDLHVVRRLADEGQIVLGGKGEESFV